MKEFVVLVVEDNVLTAKMAELALQAEGFKVLVALDAETAVAKAKETLPDLVLVDLVLPDRSGFEVARELRLLPGGEEIPIIAFSGYLPDEDEQQCVKAGFTDYLFKPVQIIQLVDTVRSYLKPSLVRGEPLGTEHRILLVDDEPSQRRVLQRHLELLGCTVETANDGLDALDKAKKNPPHVIISDVLMPRLDGFRLCQRVREDKNLSAVRILLVFSQFTDEEDRRLGLKAGADQVVRYVAPDHAEIINALRNLLAEEPRAYAETPIEVPSEEYTQKILRQIERQAATNVRCTKRLVLREAELAILASVREALQNSYDVERFLKHVLTLCCETIGLFKSAVLIREDGKLFSMVHTDLSLPETETLKGFFSTEAHFEDCKSRLPAKVLHVEMPNLSVEEKKLLQETRSKSVLLLPLANETHCFGMLFFFSVSKVLDDGRLAFGQTLASQVAQSIDSTRMVQRLRAAEERFHQLTENIEEVFWIGNVDSSRIDYVSPAYERIWEKSCASLYERPRSFSDAIHPEDKMRVLDALIKDPTGAFNEEYRIVRPDGNIRMIRARTFPIKEASGAITGVAGVAVDITEQKQLEAQSRQGQKLEAIGRLSGGIAHDFNNLLTAMKGYSELLFEGFDDGDPRKADLEEIIKAADRASALTRQLLAFSRRQVLEPKVVNLNSIILNVERMLGRLISEDIKLTTTLDLSLGQTEVDPNQFEQIIFNLVINARDAIPRGGQITIETANIDLDGEYSKEHLNMKPGLYVMMAVTDSGHGMDERTRSMIFEPFFTTKEPGKGTGLGLSTVYGIVKQSGGHIWVYSEINHGTTFKIYMPRVQAQTEVYLKPAPAAPPQPGTETVLLVEDDDTIRKLVDKVLRQYGYTVLHQSSEGDILEFCKKHKAKIDLLLTDVVMPEKSGPELAQSLKGMFPTLKVLFMSGYSDAAIEQHGILSSGSYFLQKPFTPKTLLHKIREMLDGDHPPLVEAKPSDGPLAVVIPL